MVLSIYSDKNFKATFESLFLFLVFLEKFQLMKTLLLITTSAILASLFFSCTEDSKENVIVTDPIEVTDSTQTVEIDSTPITAKKVYDLEASVDLFLKSKEVVMDLYSSHPAFFYNTDSTLAFLVGKEKGYQFNYMSEYDQYGQPNEKPLAICNENGKLMTPRYYDRIYNPGMIATGYAEVKFDGKQGLLRIEDYYEITPEYDLLFPTDSLNRLAIGKINQDYYYINPDGSKEKINDTKQYPSYPKLIVKQPFNVNDSTIQPFFHFDEYYNNEELSMYNFNRVYFVPSYLEILEFSPYAIKDVRGVNAVEGEIGDAKITNVETFETKAESKTFFTSFWEEGMDGRGYINESVQVSTVDKKGNLQSTVKLTEDKKEGYEYGCSVFEIKQFTDSIIQVKRNKKYNEDAFNDYSYSTIFEFYIITKSGELKKANLDMISAVTLTEDHFKGCFAELIPEDEQSEDSYGMEFWNSKHMSIEDLQYLRNEMFAKKGLIFKSEKWQNIFKEKDWYNPQFENVDDKLSALEKKNAAFILQMEKSMKGKEKEYTKPSRFQYVAAG